MKAELIVGIVIGWFVLRAVAKSLRANKAKLQRGGEVNQNPANMPQENAVESYGEGRTQEGRTLEREIQMKPREIKSREVVDPFMEALSLEDDRDHYNEDDLTTQYEETHAQGKTVAHHKHKLFNSTQDRQKAVHHKGSTGGASGAGGARSKQAASSGKGPERRIKRVHPIMSSLKEKGGMKRAFVVSEILKRHED